MQNYKSVEVDGIQIVQDLDSKEFYLTTCGYAKMAGINPLTVEELASDKVKNGETLYLGHNGLEGIKGQYLIPAKLIFVWLMTHSRFKAILIGTESVTASIAEAFSERTSL